MLKKLKNALSSNADKANAEDPSVVRLPAERVHGFSSQYGSETSRGYTASNLAGEARRYPDYGDFTDTCVMRTYGTWWTLAPSAPIKIGEANSASQGNDFVDLYYPKAVKPSKIEIYETYNPGAVVRILACNKAPHESFIDSDQIQWEELWSGNPEKAKPSARIFSPSIKTINFPTRFLRIEINQSLCDYYTELDAVYMTGIYLDNSSRLQDLVENSLAYLDIGKISLEDGKYHCTQVETQSSTNEREACGDFQNLPDELISIILSFLTFKDLAKMARCCKFFKTFTYDPIWYKELNLKPYWSKITNKLLESWMKRHIQPEKLDMSWTGSLRLISTAVFNRFIEECGDLLTHLRLSTCDFLNSRSVNVISCKCTSLVELDLSSCSVFDDYNFSSLKNLTKLRTLNLYRVPASDDVLIEIFRNCKELEFLNIGSNIAIENGNHVLSELGLHCRKLRGLDAWRVISIDGNGINDLCSNCCDLEEIDLGWCNNIRYPEGAILKLAESLRKLKKLFLTAIRCVNNDDIMALANHCPFLEQLDILGTGYVLPSSIQFLLEKCKNIKLLDVSFCSGISPADVDKWREDFRNVDIKKSFTR